MKNEILETLTDLYGAPNVSGEDRRKAYYLLDEKVDDVIKDVTAANKNINTVVSMYAVPCEDKTLLQIDI